MKIFEMISLKQFGNVIYSLKGSNDKKIVYLFQLRRLTNARGLVLNWKKSFIDLYTVKSELVSVLIKLRSLFFSQAYCRL